ncbi:MAG: hypothetical protein ACKVS8_07110 [Phycisphaerales bacterium]
MKASGFICVASVLALAGAAQASIFNLNSYAVQYRVFNGYAESNATANGIPMPGVDGMGNPLNFDNYVANGLGTVALPLGAVSIRDEFPFPTAEQGFANKYQAMFSSDGGGTALTLVNSESFDISFTHTLSSGEPLVRKEGGLIFFNPRGDNGMGGPLFIDEGHLLTSSNSFNGGNHTPGETAIFGAAMPFAGGGNGGQNAFNNDKVVNGQVHTVRFIYFAPGAIGPTAAYEAFFDGESSGVRLFTPQFEFDGVNGFATGTRIGFAAQFQRFPLTGDFGQADYNLTSLIPTPAAAALLGVGGLVALRRRR